MSGTQSVVSYRNSTSNHNSGFAIRLVIHVVSYRNSTSNHNALASPFDRSRLYLIEILHQTTTRPVMIEPIMRCILSKFYIKPQHQGELLRCQIRCILSKFYIKPQHYDFEKRINYSCILSKFYIKPQLRRRLYSAFRVVSYRNSTSNHNLRLLMLLLRMVVSYRNSTSNHNLTNFQIEFFELYLIEILHQTTT